MIALVATTLACAAVPMLVRLMAWPGDVPGSSREDAACRSARLTPRWARTWWARATRAGSAAIAITVPGRVPVSQQFRDQVGRMDDQDIVGDRRGQQYRRARGDPAHSPGRRRKRQFPRSPSTCSPDTAEPTTSTPSVTAMSTRCPGPQLNARSRLRVFTRPERSMRAVSTRRSPGPDPVGRPSAGNIGSGAGAGGRPPSSREGTRGAINCSRRRRCRRPEGVMPGMIATQVVRAAAMISPNVRTPALAGRVRRRGSARCAGSAAHPGGTSRVWWNSTKTGVRGGIGPPIPSTLASNECACARNYLSHKESVNAPVGGSHGERRTSASPIRRITGPPKVSEGAPRRRHVVSRARRQRRLCSRRVPVAAVRRLMPDPA